MTKRIPTDKWLVKSETGEELALVDAATYDLAVEDAKEETGLDGGFFLRRLSSIEVEARAGSVDQNTTPGLYY
jgi:hypothetical protein